MIRRNTWILLVILLALVGFSFYLKDYKAKQAAAVTPTTAAAVSSPLFAADLGQPTDVSVKDSTGKMVEVSRNADGKWVLKAPTNAEANQAAAEAAATQVTSLQVLSSVPLGFDVVGLDKPSYTMSFVFSGGRSHTLAVGAETPIQDGYYASLDKGPVRIVDKQGIDALIQLLSQPPYAASPTPPITLTPSLPATTATIELTTPASGTPAPAPSDTPTASAPTPTATP